MQLMYPFLAIGSVHTVAQQVSEQVVVAMPLVLHVQMDEKQIGPCQLFQQNVACRVADHSITQLRTEAVQDRSLQQEILNILRLAGENLIEQIFSHIEGAASF